MYEALIYLNFVFAAIAFGLNVWYVLQKLDRFRWVNFAYCINLIFVMVFLIVKVEGLVPQGLADRASMTLLLFIVITSVVVSLVVRSRGE